VCMHAAPAYINPGLCSSHAHAFYLMAAVSLHVSLPQIHRLMAPQSSCWLANLYLVLYFCLQAAGGNFSSPTTVTTSGIYNLRVFKWVTFSDTQCNMECVKLAVMLAAIPMGRGQACHVQQDYSQSPTHCIADAPV
jgi:hypothetical protein